MRELAQTFRFPGSTTSQLANLLATAPLVGPESIFGPRTVESSSTKDNVRYAVGFEPAPIPLLRFDVEISQEDTGSGTRVLLEFTQPQRQRPYLVGQFVWMLEDTPDGVILREEINTSAALEIVSRPLHGSALSVRRWLFFKGGHQRLMKDTSGNIRELLATESGPGH